MNVTFNRQGARGQLVLRGRFGFDGRHDFKRGCDEVLATTGVTELTVDMCGVSYVDSAALGMLLLLRERADAAGKTVSLATTAGVVRDTLNIANFERLFGTH